MDKNYRVVFSDIKKVEVEECEYPLLDDDQVIIKSLVSQISTGTELTMLEANVDEDSTWRHSDYTVHFPEYPGYSNVGEVVAAGAGIDSSIVGKRVFTSGPHAAYFTYDAENLNFIPESVDNEQAVSATVARIACGNVRYADICLGDEVLVFGGGIIGQFTARFARLSGALRVIVADISEKRLGFVPKEAGFYTLNSSEQDFREKVMKICGGRLPKYVFETTGNQKLVDMEMRYVADYGKLIITSSPKGKSTVDFDYINRHQLNVVGGANWMVHTVIAVNGNQWTQHRDTDYYMELSEMGLLDTKKLITHTYSYKDAAQAYEMLMEDRSQAMSVLIDWRK